MGEWKTTSHFSPYLRDVQHLSRAT